MHTLRSFQLTLAATPGARECDRRFPLGVRIAMTAGLLLCRAGRHFFRCRIRNKTQAALSYLVVSPKALETISRY